MGDAVPTPAPSLALVLADDHVAYRSCLADLLARSGFVVLGQADDAPGLMAWLAAAETRPDVVVMDLQMPGGGPQALRALLAAHPAQRVLVLSLHDETPFVTAMLAAGAGGYMLKDDALPELVDAIREVAAGRGYLSRALRPAQQ